MKIVKLHETIGKLINLEDMILYTGLNEIPDCIGNLKKLKRLDLLRNELKEIPASIGDLDMLEDLRLKDQSRFNPRTTSITVPSLYSTRATMSSVYSGV